MPSVVELFFGQQIVPPVIPAIVPPPEPLPTQEAEKDLVLPLPKPNPEPQEIDKDTVVVQLGNFGNPFLGPPISVTATTSLERKSEDTGKDIDLVGKLEKQQNQARTRRSILLVAGTLVLMGVVAIVVR